MDKMQNLPFQLLKIAAAIATISISAQITIDIGNIPITGQTLAILCWAFFLSPAQSIIALLSYLLLGCMGLPIFADGESGMEKLWGGSGGFLIGFVAGAYAVSKLKDTSSHKNTFFQIILLTTLGTAVILLFGNVRLCAEYGIDKGLDYGFWPFWKGALLKILLGALIVWSIKKYGTSS